MLDDVRVYSNKVISSTDFKININKYEHDKLYSVICF